jgi:hypothetical protein
MTPATAPATLRLRIGRLVIDAAALDNRSRDGLRAEVQAALAERLAGGADRALGGGGLARHIADAVAPQIERRLPATNAAGGGDGAR